MRYPSENDLSLRFCLNSLIVVYWYRLKTWQIDLKCRNEFLIKLVKPNKPFILLWKQNIQNIKDLKAMSYDATCGACMLNWFLSYVE